MAGGTAQRREGVERAAAVTSPGGDGQRRHWGAASPAKESCNHLESLSEAVPGAGWCSIKLVCRVYGSSIAAAAQRHAGGASAAAPTTAAAPPGPLVASQLLSRLQRELAVHPTLLLRAAATIPREKRWGARLHVQTTALKVKAARASIKPAKAAAACGYRRLPLSAAAAAAQPLGLLADSGVITILQAAWGLAGVASRSDCTRRAHHLTAASRPPAMPAAGKGAPTLAGSRSGRSCPQQPTACPNPHQRAPTTSRPMQRDAARGLGFHGPAEEGGESRRFNGRRQCGCGEPCFGEGPV